MLRINANDMPNYGWMCKNPNFVQQETNEIISQLQASVRDAELPENAVPLIALDLETTDLNPYKGDILEMFFVLGAYDHRKLEFVRFLEFSVVYQYRVDMQLNPIVQEVFDLHSRNGLFAEAGWSEVKPSDNFLTNVANIIAAFGKAVNENDPKPYLLGSGIHFDRTWLTIRSEPMVQKLHYRMFDTTTFLVASKLMGHRIPKIPHEQVIELVWNKTRADQPHRAEYDVNKSLILFLNYLKTLQEYGINFGKALLDQPQVDPAPPIIIPTPDDDTTDDPDNDPDTDPDSNDTVDLSVFVTYPGITVVDDSSNNC